MAKKAVDYTNAVPVPTEWKGPPPKKRPSKKNYWEKLKDPRWQRKRLEVMEAAGFACEACGDKESTLNVHHGHYAKGHDPWEYELETLHCLCEGCHETAEEYRHDMQLEFAKLPLESQWYLLDVVRFWSYLSIPEQFWLAEVLGQMEEDSPLPEWLERCIAVDKAPGGA